MAGSQKPTSEEEVAVQQPTPEAVASTQKPTPEEVATFTWGGQRARPRKKIEAAFVKNETYLKPPGSCNTRFPSESVSISIECCEDCVIAILDSACATVPVSCAASSRASL